MTRLFAMLAFALSLTACSEFKDLEEVPEPMGRFLLGHNVVVVNEPEIGPLSREASDDEWQASMERAVEERFRRYDGDKYYHIAVRVGAYVLAIPGIPVIAAPKSAVIVDVTIWDDANGVKLNEEPERFTVLEQLSGETVVSSGLTQSKEQQMQNLSRNTARKIHLWMLEHPEWFGDASLMDPATTSAGVPASALDLGDVSEAAGAGEADPDAP